MVEHLAALQPSGRRLQGLERLVVVSLGRRDRGMAEKVADLGKRDPAFNKAGGVLVPQVVPVHVGISNEGA
jgi:hypothetical protein